MQTQEYYNPQFDQTVGDLWGRPGPLEPNAYGLEIEVEGLPPDGLRFPLMQRWAQHEDTSLRQGTEFVSQGPQNIKDIGPAMDELLQTFAAIKFTPVFSYRTSVHVHMNVTDLTMKQVINLFCLYTIFEQVMVNWGGEERWGNVHCLTVTDNHWMLDQVRRYCDGNPVRALGAGLNGLVNRDRRYAAFNWASLAAHGTVEFRSHRGTADKQSIITWVGILDALRAACQRYEDPQQIAAEFSSMGPTAFARSIFEGHVTDQAFYDKIASHEQVLWDGMRQAQEIAFVRRSWVKPKKEKKPKATKKSLEGIGLAEGNAWQQFQAARDVGGLAQRIRADNVELREEWVRGGGPRNGDIPAWFVVEWQDRRRRAQRQAQPAQPLQPIVDDEAFGPDGFDAEGFDREGYDAGGFNRDGYDREGYDMDGWNVNGFNREGDHIDD